uniref:CD276 antigen n=1 Tax=Canis lupus familiaris TaxID=9615 RepID=A0A8P0TM22_CANLF
MGRSRAPPPPPPESGVCSGVSGVRGGDGPEQSGGGPPTPGSAPGSGVGDGPEPSGEGDNGGIPTLGSAPGSGRGWALAERPLRPPRGLLRGLLRGRGRDGPEQSAPHPGVSSGVCSGVRGEMGSSRAGGGWGGTTLGSAPGSGAGDGPEQSAPLPPPRGLLRGQWGMGPSRTPPSPPPESGVYSGVRGGGWARAERGGPPTRDLLRGLGGEGPEPSAPSPPPPPESGAARGSSGAGAGSGRAQASAGGRAAGPIPPLGRSPAAFPGPRLPRPAPPLGLAGPPPTPTRARPGGGGQSQRRVRVSRAPVPPVPPVPPPPRAESRAAGAAFHHGEPSCQLPLRKMLRRASADVGVRLAAALAALWFCITGAVEVQVPEDPVVALVGTDATLRCSFSPEPGFSLAQLNLIWQLTDTKQLVHSFAEGRDQGSAYANRTALFPDLLAQGNASLRLQRVRVADEGSFTCFVSIRDFGSAAVSLQVAAPYSKPSMTLEPSKDLRPGDTVTITCSSYRGYPEAEVLWQDGQGAPLTGNVTTSQMANEQSLFDVRSVLRVVLGANGTYSCLVRNPVLQQDARGSVTITPHRSPTGSLFLFRLCPVREGGFVPSEGLRDWNLAPYLQSPTVVKFLVVMTGKVNGVRRRGLTLLGREDSRHGPSPPLGLLTPGLRTPLERMEEHSDLPRDSKDRRGNGSISRWGFARAGYCPRPAPPPPPTQALSARGQPPVILVRWG